MSRAWTVQVGYAAWYANTVTVEADTLDEALERAIEAANEGRGRLEGPRSLRRHLLPGRERRRGRRPMGRRLAAGA